MKRRLFSILLLAAVAFATARAANTENIRIMSYNIPMGNIKVTDGNGQNTWLNRSYAIHRYLLDVAPDLIGLQEPVRQSLIDILVGIPNYALVGRGRNKEAADGGEYSCIVYRIDRFRVLDHGTYWLTETPDKYSKIEGSTHYRIATWALMEDLKTGAKFLYTNTHLSYDSEPVRLAQIKIMKQHMYELNQKYGAQLPHFLTGDFNMRDSEENYTYVLNWQLRMRDMWSTARKSVDNCSASASRIDYIYATTNVFSTYAQWDNRKTEDGFWMSDHNPIWADVYFRTSTEDDARAAVTRAWTEIDSTYAYSLKRTKLITSASQLSSDAVESSYPLSNALDLITTTYMHSRYSSTAPNNPHYLQVELKTEVENLVFNFTRRSDSEKDRWTDVMVTASDDAETWDYISHIYNFGGSQARTYTSPNIALRKPYKYVRFHVLRTPGMELRNGSPQFAVSEFQVYQNNLKPTCEYSSNENVKAAVDALIAIINSVKEKIADGSVTTADITSINEGIDALRQARYPATSIQGVQSDIKTRVSAYRLNGTPTQADAPGMIIVNGKKVFNRK